MGIISIFSMPSISLFIMKFNGKMVFYWSGCNVTSQYLVRSLITSMTVTKEILFTVSSVVCNGNYMFLCKYLEFLAFLDPDLRPDDVTKPWFAHERDLLLFSPHTRWFLLRLRDQPYRFICHEDNQKANNRQPWNSHITTGHIYSTCAFQQPTYIWKYLHWKGERGHALKGNDLYTYHPPF